jgi:hypothetical protein
VEATRAFLAAEGTQGELPVAADPPMADRPPSVAPPTEHGAGVTL